MRAANKARLVSLEFKLPQIANNRKCCALRRVMAAVRADAALVEKMRGQHEAAAELGVLARKLGELELAAELERESSPIGTP